MARSIFAIEGFDWVGSTDAQLRIDVARAYDINSATDMYRVTGEDSGLALEFRAANGDYLRHQLASAQTELIVGFTWKWNGTADTSINVFSVTSPSTGPTAYARRDVRLRLVGSGSTIDYSVVRGAGAGTVLGSAGLTLAVDTWYYTEIRVKKDTTGSNGEVTVRHKLASAAGTPANVITLTGQDTTENEGNDYDSVQFEHDAATRNIAFDHIYIAGGTGLTDSDFLGHCRVPTLNPVADGATLEWNAGGGSTVHYIRVDDPDTDDLSTNILSVFAGDRDQFIMEMLESPSTIHAVQNSLICGYFSPGITQIAAYNHLGGTNDDGPFHASVTAWSHIGYLTEEKPGGGAWSKADVNSTEFGATSAA